MFFSFITGTVFPDRTLRVRTLKLASVCTQQGDGCKVTRRETQVGLFKCGTIILTENKSLTCSISYQVRFTIDS
jgi:hypothetical protein